MSGDDRGSLSSMGHVDEEPLLAQVAWYYYLDGLTQGEIGERLGLSRIKVSRLLDRGRQSGLIQLQINSPYEGCFDLQRRLCQRFGLRDARVVPVLDGTPPRDRIALGAAQLLSRKLETNDLLAIGWGEAVMATLRRMAPTIAARAISLVGLTGGVAAYMDGIGFRRERNSVHLIPAPLRVSSPMVAADLRREPHVRDVISMARTASHALIGIGAVSARATLVQNGYCSASEMELFRRHGAVGDVLGYFYDADGSILDLELHRHVVAIAPKELGQIGSVIGAAAGAEKVGPIRGAIRGHLITTLVTDEPTAKAILEGEEP